MSDLYYLQDKRTILGNFMMFWRDGGGYTSDVSKAEVFTKEEAFRHNQCRETDVPWPKSYIDSRISKAVDVQLVCENEALEISGVELKKPEKPKYKPKRCRVCGVFIIKHWDYCSGCRD